MLMPHHGIRSVPIYFLETSSFFDCIKSSVSLLAQLNLSMADPKGTIVFTTIGRPHYGFDIFSVDLLTHSEQRLTDGTSINYDGQFVDDHQTIVYVSEKTRFSRVYLSSAQELPSVPESHFHDRPVIKNCRLYFVSAHEKPDQLFKSWSALYATDLNNKTEITRLTPYGVVDYSPAVSLTGKYIAVASYGTRSWSGEFHELLTDIVVFNESDPNNRIVVCERGGWPTFSGDSTVFFHRQADDGWWSIYRLDLSQDFEISGCQNAPFRVTPPGVHCFTPTAMHDGKRIAVATRRPNKNFRHIEIFDLESKTFDSVTESLNPNFHHYSPFVSPDSRYLGFHRFRGESDDGESTIPYLESVVSPLTRVRMLRLNGSFPSFSPDGEFIAFNPDFGVNGGIKIVSSDGSKRWNLLTNRAAFYNSWSPTEKHVIYTSLGGIFESAKSTVQIARVEFDPADLAGDGEDIPCNVKILTRDDSGNNAFPACSPDGKTLVFRSGRSGYKNLYILDAVNGEINGNIGQLTDGPWIDTMPNWSPDGKLIAFSSNRHNPDSTETFSIYVVKPDGSDCRRIYVAGKEGSSEADRERINHVYFSGDGEWLLFTANLAGVTAEPVAWPNQFQPYGDLHVVRLDGSGLRRLTWNAYENGTPTWFPEAELAEEVERRLSIGGDKVVVGEKLRGQFEELLWMSCDI